MTIKVSALGWVDVVNGIPVVKRPLPSTNYYSGWPNPPHGIMLHYTAGCQPDIFTTLSSRGISAHFNVDREGHIFQYVSLLNRAAHAYDANHTHFGIEHSALPGTCNLTQVQRDNSAKLSAGIREWCAPRGFKIATIHIPGCDLTKSGFKEHKDGIHCYWNPNGHVDNPGTIWGWDKYLALVVASAPVQQPAFKIGSRIFYHLNNALRFFGRQFGDAVPGDAHTIRVVKR